MDLPVDVLRASLATWIENPSLKSLEKLPLWYVKEAEEASNDDTEIEVPVDSEKPTRTLVNEVQEAQLQETNEKPFLLQYVARFGVNTMSKLKTHKGLAKRIKITASGRVKVRRAFAGHLRSHKSGKLMRSYRSSNYVGPADIKRIGAMLKARLTA